jgi:hypothetical protein
MAGHDDRSAGSGTGPPPSTSSASPREPHQLGARPRVDRPQRDVAAVGGLVHLVEPGAAVEEVGPPLAPLPVRPQAVHHPRQQGGAVDHRRVHDLAPPRPRRLDDPAQDAEGQQHAAPAEVADEREGRDRRPAGPADHRQRAGEGDVVDVPSRRLGDRPVLAPAGHPPVDQRRPPGQARVRPEAQPLGDAGPEALDQGIGPLDQPQDRVPPLRVLQVDADRAAAPGVDVPARCGPADRVGPVDPQHLGPHVGQHHGGERAGPDPRQLDDAETRERSGHRQTITMRRPASGPATVRRSRCGRPRPARAARCRR